LEKRRKWIGRKKAERKDGRRKRERERGGGENKREICRKTERERIGERK
jgi:hypothetical protein